MSSATWHSSFHGQVEQVNVVTKYSLADALGSVRQMTDETGTVTLARTYDPYGNVTSTGGTSSTAYGFTGETTDANGLVYLRAQNDKKSFIKNGKVPSIP